MTDLSSTRLQKYDYRAEEQRYNEFLPQYRAKISMPRMNISEEEPEMLRLHFVHRKSTQAEAVPLLMCHDWGSSFLEAAHVSLPLCEPISASPFVGDDVQPFHVVCPSIPGFGFSDGSRDPSFGIAQTAEVFHALMVQLGYDRYLLYGSGW